MNKEYTPTTDEDLAALVSRNAARLEEAKKKLGEKWLYHPSNKVVRKDKKN